MFHLGFGNLGCLLCWFGPCWGEWNHRIKLIDVNNSYIYIIFGVYLLSMSGWMTRTPLSYRRLYTGFRMDFNNF